MAVDLIKRGQTVDLTKGRTGLTHITIGLSWGRPKQIEAKKKEDKRGFLAKLFDKAVGDTDGDYTRTPSLDMDIDSSVVLVTRNGYAVDTVYYGSLRSNCGSVQHLGDDLTGRDQKGLYDNEEIKIDLSRIPHDVTKLAFIANIYQGESRNQHFGQVEGAYIRVLQTSNREELIRYNLADDFNGMRGIVVGELYRHDNEWKFRAIGQGTIKDGLGRLVQSVSHP